MRAGIDIVDPVLGIAPGADEFVAALMAFAGSTLELDGSRLSDLDLLLGFLKPCVRSFLGVEFLEIDLAVDDIFDLLIENYEKMKNLILTLWWTSSALARKSSVSSSVGMYCLVFNDDMVALKIKFSNLNVD